MEIAITSRIFEPEASAASFRLDALANAFVDAGHSVTALTVRSRRSDLKVAGHESSDSKRRYTVRRFPVLRDTSGYVRGYAQYMSFDIPLFFRILCGRNRGLIVTEPPPTTGFFVRLAAKLRRTPYVYYAADVWSDAAESTGASKVVVSIVRRMERFALSGARSVLSVNEGVTARVREIAPGSRVHTVGNGIDVGVFSPSGETQNAPQSEHPTVVYSGTASEWQGAGLFIDAFSQVLEKHPEAQLVFLGQGSDWPALQERAGELVRRGSVKFIPTVPPREAASWLRSAVVTIASIRPDAGYGFAFPTKVFASWATGTPVVYAGPGPIHQFLTEHAEDANRNGAKLGEACAYDVTEVTDALLRAFNSSPSQETRLATGAWAARTVSLDSVAARAVHLITRAITDLTTDAEGKAT